MNNHQIHTPYTRRRYRVLLLYALLAGLTLATTDLHAQTYLGQTQLGTLPSDLQIALTPMSSPERIRLSIENPGKTMLRIKVLDQKGRTYAEEFERGDKLVVPLNFSSASPGVYTITVSSSTARQSQAIVVEPPAPKRVRPHTGSPDPDWVLTSEVRLRHH